MGVSSGFRWFLRSSFLLLSSCANLVVSTIGPVEARNLHPVQMTVLNPTPWDPGNTKKSPTIGIRADWANLWLLSGKGVDAIHLDGEILRTEPFVRFPLGGDWTAELGLPLIHTSGGILDTLIETWHSFFGLPQNLRNRLPKDKQLIQVVRQDPGVSDRIAYSLEREDLVLGDIPFQLHKTLFRLERISIGIAGGIEFPAGPADRGIGNGGIDLSLGGDISFRGTRYAGFAWVHRVWVAQADAAERAGLPYSDIWKAGLGGQVGISSQFSFLTQLNFETSVIRKLRNNHANKNQALLWTGLRFKASPKIQMDLMVGEDLITDVSPDVTIHISFRMRL
jgi:hypothetical protein